MTAKEGSGGGNHGIFESASVLITGGSFTQINQAQQETGLMMLSQKISPGAMHNSPERHAAGGCHKDTREEIIATILAWVNEASPEADILWLWGPAGVGKSSILQTIAEILYDYHRERYAGGFFFAKGVPGRGQCQELFSTLAYQLACNIVEVRQAVNNAMVLDPLLPGKNMTTQLNSLIVHPLLDLLSGANHHTATIVIDGLDECHGSDNQRAILSLITKSLTQSGRVRLRFIISSRPDHAIRDEFNRPVLAKITKRIELNNSRQASRDIRKYLEDGFEEIYRRNSDVMEGVQRPWPSKEKVTQFVRNASGQFVYASAVLNFIGSSDDFSDPQTQIEVISRPGSSRASAFSALDQLYTDILTNYPRRESLMKVLAGLFVKANASTIESMFGVERKELRMVLRAIGSLVESNQIPVIIDSSILEAEYGALEVPVSFAHLSFRDFLQDRSRSGTFWINTQEVYTDLFIRFIDGLVAHLNEDDYSLAPAFSHNGLEIFYLSWTKSTIISPLILSQRLLSFGKVLTSFHKRQSGATSLLHPKELLRAMLTASSFLKHLTNRRLFPRGSKYNSATYRKAVLDVTGVIDICLKQTISLNCLFRVDKVSIFVLERLSYITLHEISEILGIVQSEAVDYLKQNSHLILSTSTEEVSREAGNRRHSLVRTYRPMDVLVAFLLDEARSGDLFVKFRTEAIRTCCDSIAQAVGGTKPFDGKVTFVSTFLEKKSLSRIESDADLETMLPLIRTFCEADWTRLGAIDVKEYTMFTMVSVVEFLHETLNSQQSSELIKNKVPELQQAILDSLKRILETMFLDHSGTCYFVQGQEPAYYEAPLTEHTLINNEDGSSVIPPYNMKHVDMEKVEDYEGSLSINITLIEKLFAGANYVLPIDRSLYSTRLLEFYLQFWATQFYTEAMCIIGRAFGGQCALLFDHAQSSPKIIVGLWTLRHLDSRCRLKPNLPSALVEAMRKYLAKQMRDYLDPKEWLTLSMWLDELTARSIARREVQSDSDWSSLSPPGSKEEDEDEINCSDGNYGSG